MLPGLPLVSAVITPGSTSVSVYIPAYLTAAGLTLAAFYNAILAYEAHVKRRRWRAILSLGTAALLVVGAYQVVAAFSQFTWAEWLSDMTNYRVVLGVRKQL